MDWVLVDGQPERHSEGTYYIEWYDNGTRRRQSVKDAAEVLEQARRKAIELDAGKAGMEIAEMEEGSRIRVRDAVAEYLKEIEPPQREPKTYTAYKYCLQLFAEHCSKTYFQDVVRTICWPLSVNSMTWVAGRAQPTTGRRLSLNC